MKIKLSAAVLGAAFVLSGCMSGILWSGDDRHAPSAEYRQIGSDQLAAFAYTEAQSKILPPNRLVMMGKQYWYVLDQKNSVDLAAVLRVPVSKRFAIWNNNGMDIEASGRLNIALQADGKFRVGRFCLHYPWKDDVKNAESAALEQALFQLSKFDKGYLRCFENLSGMMYQTPQDIEPEHRFEQSIPVYLYERSTIHYGAGHEIRKLLSPLAVAADIVTLPVQLGAVALVMDTPKE